MSSCNLESAPVEHSVVDPKSHSLHECRNAQAFIEKFAAAIQCGVRNIADPFIAASAPKAVFLVGSLPLGMGTSSSDVDLIVLVDSKADVLKPETHAANSNQRLEFSNENDPLTIGMFVTLMQGILVDLQVSVTPMIHAVQNRLRRRGPELSESEVRTLGRLSTGWLLWQTEGYLARSGVVLHDSALSVYCCTKNYVFALNDQRKAAKALDLGDIPLALQLGRLSVEMSYLAYFSSEGLPFLGAKWLAQIGYAHGAAERVHRHPLLKQGVPLLFPAWNVTTVEAGQYLQNVGEFLICMRRLIEQKMLFKIAFKACPQIAS
jgi:hypothetical protein